MCRFETSRGIRCSVDVSKISGEAHSAIFNLGYLNKVSEVEFNTILEQILYFNVESDNSKLIEIHNKIKEYIRSEVF